MSKKSFMEKLLDGVEVEWMALGEVAEIKRGTSITKRNAIDGNIPVIAGGRTAAYYHNVSNREGQTIVIAGSGAYAGFVSWWEQPIFVSDAFTVKPRGLLLARYCYHFLMNMQQQLHEFKSGGGVPHVYPRDVASVKIPIPCPENPNKSLEIQGEIVRILDIFTSLTAELTAELIGRKKQYNYYRDHLLCFEKVEVEWKTLAEIGEFIRGKRFTKADYAEDGISAIHYGEIYTRYGVWTSHALSKVRFDMADSLRYAKPGDVIIAGVGETVDDVGKAVAWIGNEKVAIHDDSYAFRHSMNPKFISYVMQTAAFIDEKAKHVSRGKVNRLLINGIEKVRIPIPYPDDAEKSLAEQARIVAILDKFDALTNSISEGLPREIALRQKQYEYYRDLLLSFPKPEKVVA
ncbi:restriction endonuclease subunit S [Salmonella enterica]|uniref:Restriction endonuclease subunit S n=2 Tax=Salmonella enterica TaxID=28901 RepID=A0A639TER4_SALER|nr:restriction endonuclease subunit S [Salmonella enterica]EBP3409225.1 restriction endonuclease subunit S [Salmonella enterica subsp. enterica]EEJ3249851.1 restriction endonuclease subunit S [Salmonella enterica subsp. enterica serovar Leeuwarden]EHC64482.1 Type I Restriction endonuclease S subunit [Salmonella enterica subsp. enterica serovar Mississippi str. A4-633]EAB3384467.1 restriction endonuclease subunit S [Salmonella enterica]EAB4379852.1 restriction endonuclease subunit S [Salmonella